MFYDKDTKTFFKDFGEIATDKDGNDFKVIFDNQYLESSPFSSSMSVNSQDMFCSVDNFDIKKLNIKAKDIITIDKTSYVIKNIRFDKNGISEIQLQFYSVGDDD